MEEGAYAKRGIARTYALIFGIVYVAIALTEVITKDALELVLEFTGIQNAVHWAVGVVGLLSFFGSEGTAKLIARIVGVVFVALTLYGFVAPDSLGELLGFEGDIPVSYNVVHAVTAVVALYAGFATRANYGRAATA